MGSVPISGLLQLVQVIVVLVSQSVSHWLATADQGVGLLISVLMTALRKTTRQDHNKPQSDSSTSGYSINRSWADNSHTACVSVVAYYDT